jgi:hypothetical protein
MKNPTEEALKVYIQEMRDHSAKVRGTLREADNEGQEKILNWVIQNNVNEIIKICGLLGVIEEVK